MRFSVHMGFGDCFGCCLALFGEMTATGSEQQNEVLFWVQLWP